MELRAWITVPGLPFDRDDAWVPVIKHLEQRNDYGAVIGWTDEGAQFVLSTDADDPAHAADILTHAVTDALRATGHGDLYPAGVEIEPADVATSDYKPVL